MSTTISQNTGRATTSALRLPLVPRRRSIPRLTAGVVLVAACTAGFVVWSAKSDERHPVLALARSVSVGHVLSAQDIRQVGISTDTDVATIAASDIASATGRTMATSLPAGALLTKSALGTPEIPSPGQGLAALALKAGQFPPEIAAGAHVTVVLIPTTSSASANTTPGSVGWPATVTSVAGRPTDQMTVISVQLDEQAARQVAATPTGQLALVLTNGGAR